MELKHLNVFLFNIIIWRKWRSCHWWCPVNFRCSYGRVVLLCYLILVHSNSNKIIFFEKRVGKQEYINIKASIEVPKPQICSVCRLICFLPTLSLYSMFSFRICYHQFFSKLMLLFVFKYLTCF